MVMARAPYDRGTSIHIPAWWRALLDSSLEGEERTHQQLAEELSKLAGRADAWDRSKVTNFINDENTTVEMALAFSKLYPSIPRIVFYPRSYREAMALEATSSRYPASTPDYDGRADEMDTSAEGHTRPVSSLDEEGRDPDRQPPGAPRRGPHAPRRGP